MLRFVHRHQKRIIERDMLSRLEEGISILERILPFAKQDLKDDHALVDAGKAKRVDNASIRHLNAHPQYLHEGEAFCPVRPEKILSLFSVEAKDTYENRFLMTLAVRLSSFLEQRFDFASQNPSVESLVVYSSDKENVALVISSLATAFLLNGGQGTLDSSFIVFSINEPSFSSTGISSSTKW